MPAKYLHTPFGARNTLFTRRAVLLAMVVILFFLWHAWEIRMFQTAPQHTYVHLQRGSLTSKLRDPVGESQQVESLFYRRPNGDIDCDLVFTALGRLYEESKARQAAWRGAGYDVTVRDHSGKRVDELHILLIGDSWIHRAGHSLARHLDVCRMLHSAPLIERDECEIQFTPDWVGHSMYQLSKAAFGIKSFGALDEADYVRVHIHFNRQRFLGETATQLENVLSGLWPTPSFTTATFPTEAQCRRALNETVEGLDDQMPLCLCQDTVDLKKEGARRVPADAILLVNGMWHTQHPTMETDQFTFDTADTVWYKRQARFVPSRLDYPFLTWEQNLERVRQFLTNGFAVRVRQTVASVVPSAPAGVVMPRVLISRIPNVNCSAPKFQRMPTLTSCARCEELAWPLHDVVDNVVRAAYGEPLLGLPAIDAPDWLRLVNYRSFSASMRPEQVDNNTGQPTTPGEHLCTMSDGMHFDTSIWSPDESPHVLWCAKHVHRLFWEEMVR